jgi:hypothetical protein
MIGLFFELVIQGAASFRSASACLELMSEYLPWAGRTPTAWCGQLWMWRIGLYELCRPKEQVDDRVWIIDHTVQIGTTKCLLIVGVRLSWWQDQRRPLQHRDLEVLMLEPVEKSNGDIVRIQLECTAEATGVPRAIVSDHGTDLTRGIADFQQEHPETASVYDIAHKLACILKKELDGDERWTQYVQHLGRSKSRLQQTDLAFLIPPSPKIKARYMNLEEQVRWGMAALKFLDNPRPVEGVVINQHALREKLGWLTEYREDLAVWNSILDVVSMTLDYVRHEGYHRRAAGELKQRFNDRVNHRSYRRVASQIIEFVKEQSASAELGEHLIGSSECLESLIGTGKRLERQQSKSGFTKMVLAMAASVVEPTAEYLQKALEYISTEAVYEWGRDLLGHSVQSQRRIAFDGSIDGTKPG